jgi:cell division protein ZapE
VEAAALIAQLSPPPHFVDATFESYHPDPNYPSQTEALDKLRDFASTATRGGVLRRSGTGKGVYLDGGFGVGKTHLLAAIAHRAGKKAAFGTFVEYTSLVGAIGFQATRQGLQKFSVVCIDEFELDDPGDTVMMSRLMRELSDAGVSLAATSNTLPGSLGQGRFAAKDFTREIQAVASVFDVLTIDGDDYRHRGEVRFPRPSSAATVLNECDREDAACEDWRSLIDDLIHVHPSRFGAYVSGVSVLGLRGVAPLQDQGQALRLVALVDRLYDNDVRIVHSGHSLAEVFTAEMLRGGYRKKYFRALSRLAAMCVAEAPSRP